MSSIGRIGFDCVRVFARVGAAAVLLLLSSGAAAEIGKACSPGPSEICQDPELRSLAEAVDVVAARKEALLGPKGAQDLRFRQSSWWRQASVDCGYKPPGGGVGFHPAAGWPQCLRTRLEERATWLAALPTYRKPKAPYLLSPFERAFLADGDRIGSMNQDFGDQGLLAQSLRRILKAILLPPHVEDGAWYTRHDRILEAASGGGGSYERHDQRYILGWSCQSHFCPHRVVIVADTETGEVALAEADTGSLQTYNITCNSKRFRDDSHRLLVGWAQKYTVEMNIFTHGKPVEIEDFDAPACQS